MIKLRILLVAYRLDLPYKKLQTCSEFKSRWQIFQQKTFLSITYSPSLICNCYNTIGFNQPTWLRLSLSYLPDNSFDSFLQPFKMQKCYLSNVKCYKYRSHYLPLFSKFSDQRLNFLNNIKHINSYRFYN